MDADAIIFDFDGVLLESEHEINQLIARLLTDLGQPTSVREATEHFTGLSGQPFIDAVEMRLGAPLPPEFHETMRQASGRALAEGLEEVAGAVAFVRRLPQLLPKGSRRRARRAGCALTSTILGWPTCSAATSTAGRSM